MLADARGLLVYGWCHVVQTRAMPPRLVTALFGWHNDARLSRISRHRLCERAGPLSAQRVRSPRAEKREARTLKSRDMCRAAVYTTSSAVVVRRALRRRQRCRPATRVKAPCSAWPLSRGALFPLGWLDLSSGRTVIRAPAATASAAPFFFFSFVPLPCAAPERAPVCATYASWRVAAASGRLSSRPSARTGVSADTQCASAVSGRGGRRRRRPWQLFRAQ